MLLCCFYISGCGHLENAPINSTGEVIQETEDALVELPVMEVSRNEVEIGYEGGLIIKYITAYGNTIYLGGKDGEGKYDIHKMDYEAFTSESLEIELLVDMVILDIETDTQGNLHMFWSNAFIRGTQWGIWVIDQEGNICKKMDVTEVLGEERTYLFATAIDAAGRYYLRSNKADEAVLVLNGEGEEITSIPLENGMGLREAIGRGKDGQVYAGVTEASDDSYVALLDVQEGKIKILSDNPLPNVGSLFSALGAGTDTDLLLYGPGTGIIAYDVENHTASNRLWISDFPANTEGNNCVCFLPDGRMLFLEKAFVPYSEETSGIVDRQIAEGSKLHYIPVGK